jgi:hypothetical protein
MALRSERRFISKNNIKSGMLVEFSYKKIKDGNTGSYMVLVIDPAKKNESSTNDQLHGLLVDDLSDMDLVRISTEFGQVFNYSGDNRSNPITNLQSDEAYARYTTSTIKNDRRYRTFVVDNISSLRQILIGELE